MKTMSDRSRRRARLLLENLEDRLNPSTPTFMQSLQLPGANSAWDFAKAPFIASPVTADLFNNGQQEVITAGGDGNLYAYQFNSSDKQFHQILQYFTGTSGAGVP